MNGSKFFVAAVLLSVISCTTLKSAAPATPKTVSIDLKCTAVPSFDFRDLSRGIQLYVNSNISAENIVDASEAPASQRKFWQNANIQLSPSVRDFVTGSMTQYVRSMGISVGRNASADYVLRVRVKDFRVISAGDNSGRAVVELEYTLCNTDNDALLRQTARGRSVWSGQTTSLSSALDKAYSEALSNMDWNGIYNHLAVHKRAEQEAQRQVSGEGNTALEHTIIRWFIDSRPAGADVSWRIISSTPDVKNTNATYVGTTPYETTESFDIRGLKFENSGNVQIEVKCEKPGYLPQTRRFNLRQAIEQREISAKFNLVKDED